MWFDLVTRYDLYDCDLGNAMAAPGSLFAPAYWGDTTPTIELDLHQLFPDTTSASSSSSFGSSASSLELFVVCS